MLSTSELFYTVCSRAWAKRIVRKRRSRSHYAGLDTTIAADVQASVYESLGEIQNLQWVGLGFPMASVAIILFVGRLYEAFNMKWLITAALAIFEIGSAVCGAAPTSDALIIGRVIAGMGGSGMYLG